MDAASRVRFISRVHSPQLTSSPQHTDKSSPILPVLALFIIVFLVWGSMTKDGAVLASRGVSSTNYGSSTAKPTTQPMLQFPEVDVSRALVPVAAVGILVLAARSGKLPHKATELIDRVFASDLAALFLTVAYAHYIFNFEKGHTDQDEQFYDAIFRIGAFVAAIYAARHMIAKSSHH